MNHFKWWWWTNTKWINGKTLALNESMYSCKDQLINRFDKKLNSNNNKIIKKYTTLYSRYVC